MDQVESSLDDIKDLSTLKIPCYMFLDDDQSKENLEKLVKNYEYFDFYYKDNIYFIDDSVCTNIAQFTDYASKVMTAKSLSTEKVFIINAYTLEKIFNDKDTDFDGLSFFVHFIALYDSKAFKFTKGDFLSILRKNSENGLFCVDTVNFFVFLFSDENTNQKLYKLRNLLLKGDPVYMPRQLLNSKYASDPSLLRDFPLNSFYKKN